MATLSVEDYYNQNRFTFRYLWNSRRTHAIHFGFYDENATRHDEAIVNMNRVLADWVGVSANDVVLDAGCGVGGSAIWLAQQRGCAVKGVVLVKSQADEAAENVKKAGLCDKIQIFQADFNHTPFEDESFDVVWALESHCHTDQKAEFYREAFRLLRKGGRLVMADVVRSRRDVDTEGGQLLARGLSRWAIPDIDTPEEHRRNAEAAGFSQFECRNVNPHVRRSLLNAYEHALRWRSTARFLNRLGIINATQVSNAEGTRLQFEAWEKDLWFYGLMKMQK